MVGTFDDLDGYAAFVRNSFRFRQLVEPALAGNGAWTIQSLLPELRLDLEDMRLGQPVQQPSLDGLTSESARLGACYVLEGSALGAHVLLRRALSLGLSIERGARHLGRQAGSPGRWRDFLHFLDTRQDVDRPTALAAARRLFEQALSVYSGARS